MRNITIYLTILFAFIATTAIPSFGGPNHNGHRHDHAGELSESLILERASGFVATIVEKGRLEASWSQIKPQKARKNDRHEWVISFFNPEIKDPQKQTLYLFLSLSGEYIAANFVGK